MSSTPVHSPIEFPLRMNFSNVDSGGKKYDPVISSWANLLQKTDSNEKKAYDTKEMTSQIEEEIKQGTLTNLRGLLKELDETAWKYES